MRSVRLWYEKASLAIYTSHLDMNRCFSRAVTRAEIPLWYTEGFNPHPYMTFLAPLALGQTGKREPVDIRIEEDLENREIMDRLNKVLPEGLRIVDVTEPVHKANEIALAEYKIRCEFNSKSEAEAFKSKASEIIESGEMMAEKRSKKGLKTVNLCTMIHKVTFTAVENIAVIQTVLSAGNTENLNPQLFTETLLNAAGMECICFDMTRECLLTADNEKFA